MYHKAELFKRAYYDTIEEMPKVAKVYFPDKKEPVEMTSDEMLKLSDEGWYTILHEVNYGCCDHWTSVKLEVWVRKRFNQIVILEDKNHNIVGYNRMDWSVRLTKDKNFRKSEVWNS